VVPVGSGESRVPLLPFDQVVPLLVCPRCRSPLARAGDGLRCGAASCPCAARAFPTVGGHPALVDFERSIVAEQELVRGAGSSPVQRSAARGPAAWLRRLVNPPNRVAERHAALLIERLRGRGGRPTLLVVGGGTVGNGAQALYQAPELGVIAFDIYASPWTQLIADAHGIPLADRSVDAVWVQAVLEHVLDPARAVAEIERVLADDGLVYAETPFLQQVHEGAYDFTRFTESGHRWLFRRFERLDSGVVAGPGNQLAWTFDYVTRALLRSIPAGRAARVASFWVEGFDRVIPERFAIDGASCVYFFGRRAGRELTPREIVAHYRGAQRRKG
jgi:SAM-dependent methyltransferase